jgi:protein farnesyltransferase/geranylgeranyltransferase type-1 subunit alpha
MLDLSTEILTDLNSAHYSIWEWHWRCLQHLGGAASPELTAEEERFMRRVATDNPKNYQLWNHRRRWALAAAPDSAAGDREAAFSAACLAHDAKNYHAWAHRQAVISAFGGDLWRRELEYTELLLEDDLRNNSAWNQRFFVLSNAPEAEAFSPLEGSSSGCGPWSPRRRYHAEVDFVATKLRLAPHNDSAWAYMRGLTTLHGAPVAALAADVRIAAACKEALGVQPSCAPALLLYADVLEEQAAVLHRAAAGSEGTSRLEMAELEAVRLAVEVLGKLEVADPIRYRYFRWRKDLLAARLPRC